MSFSLCVDNKSSKIFFHSLQSLGCWHSPHALFFPRCIYFWICPTIQYSQFRKECSRNEDVFITIHRTQTCKTWKAFLNWVHYLEWQETNSSGPGDLFESGWKWRTIKRIEIKKFSYCCFPFKFIGIEQIRLIITLIITTISSPSPQKHPKQGTPRRFVTQ